MVLIFYNTRHSVTFMNKNLCHHNFWIRKNVLSMNAVHYGCIPCDLVVNVISSYYMADKRRISTPTKKEIILMVLLIFK